MNKPETTYAPVTIAFMDLNLYWIKGALVLFVLVSGYVCQIKLYTQLSSPH